MATNREQFLKKHNIPTSQSLSTPEIARIAKMPLPALMESERRGAGAYRTQPESIRVKGTFAKNPNLSAVPLSGRLSQQQWAKARAYAFANKSKKVYYGADDDIRKKYGLK
jgi:hypothetical protein